jgi:hypothetical protein
MQDTLESLRVAIHRNRPPVPSQGYPLGLRQRVGRHARLRRAQGETWTGIGSSLGLGRSTVRNWAAAVEFEPEEPTSSMVPVLVAAEEQPVMEASEVVLVSPRGFRLVGLSVPAAIEALEQLG